MALPNFFSCLDGKEGDVEEVILLAKEEKKKAREAQLAKEEEERKKELEENQNWSRPHSRHSDNGRGSNWQGAKYYGQGPRRNAEAVHQSNGYQQKQGPTNGYQLDNHGGNLRDNHVIDGVPSNDGYSYRGNNRRNDGYRGDYRGNDGYGYRGNYRNKGYQGEGNGYSYKENNIEQNGHGGDNHYDVNEGEQSQVEGGWVPSNRRTYGRDFANGNGRRGRGSNQGYYKNKSQSVNEGQEERSPRSGEHVDEKEAGDQVSKTSEDKEVQGDENSVNADGSVVVNEASKEEVKPKQKKQNGEIIRKRWSEMTEEEKKIIWAKRAEERAKEIEEDKKLMTLEQFEKIRLEKKKALLEALKTQEKEVTTDKDCDLTQPMVENQEEKKADKHSEEQQLKSKNNHGKKEETNILKEFYNSSGGGRKFVRRGGQSDGRRFDGQRSRNWEGQPKKASNVVKLEDESQFPVLGGRSSA